MAGLCEKVVGANRWAIKWPGPQRPSIWEDRRTGPELQSGAKLAPAPALGTGLPSRHSGRGIANHFEMNHISRNHDTKAQR